MQTERFNELMNSIFANCKANKKGLTDKFKRPRWFSKKDVIKLFNCPSICKTYVFKDGE